MVIGERALLPLPGIRHRQAPCRPARHWLPVLVAGLLLGTAGAAGAHAHLRSASPPVDGVVAAAPAEVTATFTEQLEAKLSSLVVKDSAGRAVSTGDVRLPPGSDGRTLAVSVSPLSPGTYTVQWGAASVDTHKTTGSFSFVVRP
ncbi:copper resistance protein CopC [Ancylobacter oerskovii]|uniref:Copper resistance protein CopC n=1 Tax=Ancylobacter oerskovii TaxID=459519 RepID=A0ABW4Z2C1_9HYPH|nr:copper resistance protein CopC [Ancylobacter oerskovii]MBS7544828.1 copper resistance protein CopC [Ancylobacter oerskovii]